MGLLKISLKQNTKDEKTFECQSCKGMLYPLDGSVEQIYVCESCGKSFDYNALIDKNNQNKNMPIYELFNTEFMRKYTNFECFDEFLKECPIVFDNMTNSFDESIPLKYPRKWNKYVKKHTSFSSWNEMFEKAIEVRLHI